MKVRQILARKGGDVQTISPSTTIGEAAAILSEKRIGCLVVTDGGAIAGILSERDVVRRLGRDGAGCMNTAVGEIMTAKVVCCAPDDDDASILSRMTDGRFRHMPVTEAGGLIGLISIGDVVKARIDSLEMDNQAMESLIRSATA